MKNKWFTLVEIMVAITIFMIVMVSVMQIFWLSSQLTNKVDINRQVQENIKNLTETISEDVRNYWIAWVKQNKIDSYSLSDYSNIIKGPFLKLWSNTYYLSLDNVNYIALNKTEVVNECTNLDKNCFLVKNDWITSSRLTNSWIEFENIEFTIMWDKIKKLAINAKIRPSTKKWIRPDMIKNSKLIFQTTISERFVKTN